MKHENLIITIGLVVLLAAVAVTAFVWFRPLPFQRGPKFKNFTPETTDGRKNLRKVADTGRTLISALTEYLNEHGELPLHIDDLPLSYLSSDFRAKYIITSEYYDSDKRRRKFIPFWDYVREGENSFKLYANLSWDERLIYKRVGNHGTWTYDPGDGSEPVELDL